MTGAPVSSDGTPAGLMEAFWEYDRALLANDVTALDARFTDADTTLRGDGTATLVGHAAIARFRASRSTVPTRTVQLVHVRVIDPTAALVVAEVASRTGAAGLQTQLWRRRDDAWTIDAAHVTAPQQPIDRSVWRIVGTPLVAPTGSGALDGETVAVKDLFAVEGQRIGAGVPEFAASAPPEATTAPAVGVLLSHGAEVTGIAQTDQFAYSIAGTNSRYGTPDNVAAPGRIPGGSTSGPSVAVARGWASIGLGTDTAGSIRVPAAHQGLWGIRTTHGIVDRSGVLALAPSFDTVGWITRDVETLARVADVLVPETATGDSSGTTAPQLVIVDTLTDLASTGVRDAFIATADALGAVSVPLTCGDGTPVTAALLEEWFHAFRTVQAFEAWSVHGDWIDAHPGALDADVAGRFADASAISRAEHDAARTIIDAARSTIRSFLSGRILLLPSTAAPAAALDASPEQIDHDRGGTLRLTCLASIAGVPAVSAPLDSVDGLPSGVCFIGAPNTDVALIASTRRLTDRLGP
ncbi:AtzH-like domain-containing protein [Plantibacter sp. Mn2098]|uniref:AtzH-like domain-containing protein n=1 Tax=Plantibacter sp. Mn2098 TaxID=3395266 RepID=UPI003BCDE38A